MRREELAGYDKIDRFGYDLTDERDYFVYRCHRCGSLVGDRKRHDEWHYEVVIDVALAESGSSRAQRRHP